MFGNKSWYDVLYAKGKFGLFMKIQKEVKLPKEEPFKT
jgi:hypothetical protein